MLEVVFATFLVLFMLLTIMSMFTLSARPAGSNKNIFRACALTEKKFEEVRAWAYSKENGKWNFNRFGDANDDPWLNSVGTDSDYPDLTWRVAGAWETQATDEDLLQRSARKVRVEVNWQEGSETRGFVVAQLIAEPIRELDKLELTPSASAAQSVQLCRAKPCGDLDPPEPHRKITYRVQGLDTEDDPIADLSYKWTVLPETADGIIRVDGNPSTYGPIVEFHPTSIREPLTEGTCRVRVSAVCGGREVPANYIQELQCRSVILVTAP